MDKNFLLDLCKRINLGKEETQSVISTLNLEFAKVAAVVKKCSMLPINAVLHSASEHERKERLCVWHALLPAVSGHTVFTGKKVYPMKFFTTL